MIVQCKGKCAASDGRDDLDSLVGMGQELQERCLQDCKDLCRSRTQIEKEVAELTKTKSTDGLVICVLSDVLDEDFDETLLLFLSKVETQSFIDDETHA